MEDQFSSAFMQALHEWSETGDPAPIIAFLRSDEAITSAERDSVAAVLELTHVRAQPKAKGRPTGGRSAIAGNAAISNKLAAYFAHRFREAWRAEHPGQNVPRAQNDLFIQAAIAEVEKHSKGARKPDAETVKTLISKGKFSPI